jgi:hypothetical protein
MRYYNLCRTCDIDFGKYFGRFGNLCAIIIYVALATLICGKCIGWFGNFCDIYNLYRTCLVTDLYILKMASDVVVHSAAGSIFKMVAVMF